MGEFLRGPFRFFSEAKNEKERKEMGLYTQVYFFLANLSKE